MAGQHAFLFPSVDELFAMIWHQLEQGAPIVDATYHPVYGYPVQVAIGLPHPDGVVVYQTSDFSAEVQVHASASGRHDRLK